jgi:hypothetical protein
MGGVPAAVVGFAIPSTTVPRVAAGFIAAA